MNPATAVLIGLAISVLQFIGTMLYISSKIGEYKVKIDSIPRSMEKAEGAVVALHTRLDFFWNTLTEQSRDIGKVEGQLERINGKDN